MKKIIKDKNKKEKIDYVSLCKAAKISGYAQDYLSLLCRQGKLKGEKIGRNWVTTYQWLDEYQRNLISDMGLKKNSIAPGKDFKEIKKVELVLATSLFFLILLGGFTYAKNPQFFSDITEQAYQTKDRIVYRISEMKENILEGDTTSCRLQNSFKNFSKGASVFFKTTDRKIDEEKEFGQVAGASDSVEVKPQQKLRKETIQDKIIFKIKKNLFKIQDKLGDTYLTTVDYLFPRIMEPENYLLAMPFYKTHKFLPETKSGGEGVVVMPMEGNTSSPNNQEIVKKLNASFSDEVEVEPEDSGRFGKIKPTNPAFPEEEYLYLIVPMKE